MMPRVKQCRMVGCHKLAKNGKAYCADHQDLEQEMNNRHDKTMVQRYNKIDRRRNETKRDQSNFYRTKQWVGLRQQVLERDNYMCQYCQAMGRVKSAKVVDHIVPIEYRPDDRAKLDNLAVICGACHTRKTKWEQSYYGTGRDNEAKTTGTIKNVKTIAKLIEVKI